MLHFVIFLFFKVVMVASGCFISGTNKMKDMEQKSEFYFLFIINGELDYVLLQCHSCVPKIR